MLFQTTAAHEDPEFCGGGDQAPRIFNVLYHLLFISICFVQTIH